MISFRTATKADLNSIMEIEAASFLPEIQESKSTFIARLTAGSSLFLIFEENLENGNTIPAGYLSAEFLEKIPSSQEELKLDHSPSTKNTSTKIIYLSSFALLPQFRGNGQGKRLWNDCLDFFAKTNLQTEKFLLIVNEEWKNARHIYEQNGFTPIDNYPEFFPHKENGILMIRDAR